MKEYVIEVHYDAVKKVSVFSETEDEAKKMAEQVAEGELIDRLGKCTDINIIKTYDVDNDNELKELYSDLHNVDNDNELKEIFFDLCDNYDDYDHMISALRSMEGESINGEQYDRIMEKWEDWLEEWESNKI